MTGFGTNHQSMKGQNFPKNGPILLKAAIKAHEKGNIEKAESLYIKTIISGFQHEILFSNLGVIYMNTGRNHEALEMYKRAISINPNLADAYYNLAILQQI